MSGEHLASTQFVRKSRLDYVLKWDYSLNSVFVMREARGGDLLHRGHEWPLDFGSQKTVFVHGRGVLGRDAHTHSSEVSYESARQERLEAVQQDRLPKLGARPVPWLADTWRRLPDRRSAGKLHAASRKAQEEEGQREAAGSKKAKATD